MATNVRESRDNSKKPPDNSFIESRFFYREDQTIGNEVTSRLEAGNALETPLRCFEPDLSALGAEEILKGYPDEVKAMQKVWGGLPGFYCFATKRESQQTGVLIYLAQPGSVFELCEASQSHNLGENDYIEGKGVYRADEEANKFNRTLVSLEKGGCVIIDIRCIHRVDRGLAIMYAKEERQSEK